MDESKIEDIEQFQKRLSDAATALLRHVKSVVQDRKWKSAYVDARGGAGNSGTVEKFAVEYADAKIDRSGFGPLEVTDLVADVWEYRKDIFPQMWYGIKIAIFPDGRCVVDYNYDSNCLDDPSFIDVDDDS